MILDSKGIKIPTSEERCWSLNIYDSSSHNWLGMEMKTGFWTTFSSQELVTKYSLILSEGHCSFVLGHNFQKIFEVFPSYDPLFK